MFALEIYRQPLEMPWTAGSTVNRSVLPGATSIHW